MKGAKGVLINITGGLDMTLFEVDEAANRIREEVDADANIIFGSTFDATMQGRMRVSVVATGIAAMAAQQPAPNYLSLDMNRPMQTGQPALSRPVAPPVGRVAMPTAAARRAGAAAPLPWRPPAAMAPPAAAGHAPAPVPPRRQRRSCASMPTPGSRRRSARSERPIMAAPPVEAPGRSAPAPAPMRRPPSRSLRAPVAAAPAPAPAAPQRPLVDENDWRVSRPSTARRPVRAPNRSRDRWPRARPADSRVAQPVPAHHRRFLGAEAR